MKAEKYNSQLHGEPIGTAARLKGNYFILSILFIVVGAVFGIAGGLIWAFSSIIAGIPLVVIAVIIVICTIVLFVKGHSHHKFFTERDKWLVSTGRFISREVRSVVTGGGGGVRGGGQNTTLYEVKYGFMNANGKEDIHIFRSTDRVDYDNAPMTPLIAFAGKRSIILIKD